uniref:Vesicle transport protein n=1 Tax=Maconellicoccus hirsutus TaxID=177089 RepID=A2I445_MACHI|nr:hypothetical protein [Maconellicoccus hirsutus]
MDKLRRALSGDDNYDEDSSTGIFNNLDSAVSLSWSSRIKAFGACFIIGLIFSLCGSFALFVGKLATFAVFYTLGNIISIASTCFLMGPLNQLKKMFASTRIIATIVAILMIVLTLVSALYLKKAGLSLMCIILQFLALTWYSISYIPFARDAVKKTVTSCV